MPIQSLQAQLENLYDLILRERECAKAVDIDALQAVSLEKAELLKKLELTEEVVPAFRTLVEKIKQENRRNAYLFWSTLKYIRESMGFFNSKIGQPSYGAAGQMTQNSNSGLVIKGRV